MRIVTFNVQNLRLRRQGRLVLLDGARDEDDPGPVADPALDAADRRLTAAVIARADADVVCLQEVYDLPTLDHFHDDFLLATGAAPWAWRVCLPGNDGHGRDVALMSRLPLAEVASHAALVPADLGLAPPPGIAPEVPLFRRDCLRAQLGPLTLFLVHFKAPWPDPAAAHAVRRLEAEAVRRLIARRFGDDPEALWLVLGDFNEPAAPPPGGRAIAPLLAPFGIDLMERMPEAERWSYHLPAEAGAGAVYSRPDGMIAAPALARRFPAACPVMLREGLAREAARFAGPRLPGVGRRRPHASDHAALLIEFPGL
jgi:endonuclease/exonuclease/phosphatase family metal-dependent hydrolase